MIKLVYLFLLIICNLTIYAQNLPNYTVDLDQEMRYKINASNWQNRGKREFKRDIEVLFKKIDFGDFVTDKRPLDIFYEIEFDAVGKPKLSLLGTSYSNDSDLVQKTIKRKLTNIVKHFKPASYNGKVISKTYLISFTLWLNDSVISVRNINFEPTLTFDSIKADCFTVYNNAEKNFPTETIFTAAEIQPIYKSGNQFLCFKINRILNTKKRENNYSNFGIDSVEIPFIVDKNKKLGFLDISFGTNLLKDEILDYMIKTSCDWFPAMFSGRQVIFGLRMRFIYEYYMDAITKNRKLISLLKIKTVKAKSDDFAQIVR
ncbi:MAG: hypothetical protein ACI35V_01855 [Sphingobacterium composti]|uniref:hypothetical protein n=1 Tax=Sphingobacterium composti TaxID=363260 RepID=UPI001357CC76|nr:hypothetical protein [Sphingobacterium composti Ten et al. 2007 non Yoo et al. 2007]